MRKTICLAIAVLIASVAPGFAQGRTYKVLSTSKTSTMQKEMQEAGDAGFRFVSVMGGETAIGGKEVVVLMEKAAGDKNTYGYRLLATSKTSTLQKELQEAADAGFAVVGQTVFESMFGGKETAAIVEKGGANPTRYEYKLLATSKTSTMEKELKELETDAPKRDREVLIACDAAYTVRTLDESVLPYKMADEHQFRRSLKEIQRYRERTPGALIIPGHDWDSFSALDPVYE